MVGCENRDCGRGTEPVDEVFLGAGPVVRKRVARRKVCPRDGWEAVLDEINVLGRRNQIALYEVPRNAAQLAGKCSECDVLPGDGPVWVALDEVGYVDVDCVLQAEVTGGILVEQPQNGEGLGDAGDAVRALPVDFFGSGPRAVLVLRRVERGPQRRVGGCYLNRVG